MPAPSEERRRSKRRRVVLSWIPISIVALICVGVVVGAVAVQNSWWTQADPRPSTDQQASDGMSLFEPPGIDFLTHEGVVRVKVRADSLPASQLGLDVDGTETVEPRVPISAVVLTADGAFNVELVKSFTITTSDNQVTSVELVQDGQGMWLTIYPQLQRIAPSWGWTAQQLEQLRIDLTTASRDTTGPTYSATLPAVEHKGALASAEVTIDTDSGNVGLAFTVARLP